MNKLKKRFWIRQTDIVSNMALSGICKPVSMVLSYIYVPIVLDYLGVEKYGVWSTILTILSWVSYFDIGIGNGLRNRLTESLNKHDHKSKKLISSAYAFISVIMLIMVILFSVAASFLDWNRIFGISDIEDNLTLVVITSVIFVAINFVLSICKNVLYSLQQAAHVSIMELMTQIFNLLGLLIVKQFVTGNLFLMAFIYGMSMVIVELVTTIILYKKRRELRPGFQYIDMQSGKQLTNLGVQFFIIQISALILFTTDSLIISRLYGAASVTTYSTINKMFNALIGVYSALLTPVWSAVTRAKVERHYEMLRRLLTKLRLIMLLFLGATLILMIVFRPLMRLWLRQELNYSTVLVLLGGMYCILSNWCNTYANIANGLELMKVSMITAVIQASVNIPLSLLFAEVFAMESAGVLAGTILSMGIAAIVLPIAVHRSINKGG